VAQQDEEIGLVISAMGGDLSAFEDLVRSYERFVFAIVSKHVPESEVDSVAQVVFIGLYRSISTLRDPAAFRGWLHGIAVRRCRDFWRQHYRQAKHETQLSALPAETIASFKDPSDQAHRHELNQLLEQLLGSLSAEDRMIMTLLYLEDRPVSETATLLGLSQVNVKVRAHRIRKKLETKLKIINREVR